MGGALAVWSEYAFALDHTGLGDRIKMQSLPETLLGCKKFQKLRRI